MKLRLFNAATVISLVVCVMLGLMWNRGRMLVDVGSVPVGNGYILACFGKGGIHIGWVENAGAERWWITLAEVIGIDEVRWPALRPLNHGPVNSAALPY